MPRLLLMLVCTGFLALILATSSAHAKFPACTYTSHTHVVRSTLHWHWIVPSTHEESVIHAHAADDGCTDKVLPGTYGSHRLGLPGSFDPIPVEAERL